MSGRRAQSVALPVVTFACLLNLTPEVFGQETWRPTNTELTPGVWGRVAVPAGAGPFPAVVLVHGGSGEKLEQAELAAELTERGYVTLML